MPLTGGGFHDPLKVCPPWRKPLAAALPEALHRPLAVSAVLRRGGKQMRNGLSVPGYGDGFTALYHTKQLGQTRPSFAGLNLTHTSPQPVCYHYQSTYCSPTRSTKPGGKSLFTMKKRRMRRRPAAASLVFSGVQG